MSRTYASLHWKYVHVHLLDLQLLIEWSKIKQDGSIATSVTIDKQQATSTKVSLPLWSEEERIIDP